MPLHQKNYYCGKTNMQIVGDPVHAQMVLTHKPVQMVKVFKRLVTNPPNDSYHEKNRFSYCLNADYYGLYTINTQLGIRF